MSFLNYKAFQELKKLSEKPIDLCKELTSERLLSFKAEALGLKLFFGTERVSEKILETLFSLAKEAHVIEKMHAMQAGERVNFIEGFPSENRAALHTAMRDFFKNSHSNSTAKEATHLALQEIEKLKKTLPLLESFTDLVQIGIGGSSLGPEAIALALEAYVHKGKRVHFAANIDPDEIAQLFRNLDLKKTVVVVVSKSGSTLETVTNEMFVREKFKKAGIDSKSHFIAVTGKGSPMDNPSLYLASFYIWDYIGGRYSVTSMVGAVALAFALGIETLMQFLEGASEMDKLALHSNPRENLPLLAALLGIWNRNFLHYPTVAIIAYSHALRRFSAHLQQLDMESNGKRIDKNGQSCAFETGPIIWGEPGTNGQHSFYQLIHQGTTTVALEMIGFIHSQYEDDIKVQSTFSQEKLLSNLFAQSIALAQGKTNPNPNKFFPGNRPNSILLGKKADPKTVGKILSYYEHKVAFQGFIWNINSFDQEGVQLGKVLALKTLSQFAAKRGEKKEDFPLGETYLKMALS